MYKLLGCWLKPGISLFYFYLDAWVVVTYLFTKSHAMLLYNLFM